jgi:hypothetical protein
MNTIFTNEKLGMPVEELRLRDIRQQIESQRIADQLSTPVMQSARRRWFERMISLLLTFALLTRLSR